MTEAPTAAAQDGLTPADRRLLLEVLGPRVPRVVARTAERGRAEVPEYADLAAGDIAGGVQESLAIAIAALMDGRPFTADEEVVLGRIGDLRAAQGLPLEAMLRVYRITVDEILCELWAAVDSGDVDAGQSVQLTRELWAYAGPLMDLATDAYRRRELAEAVADSERRVGLVHELLLSPAAAPHAILGALGLDPIGTYVTFRARAAHDQIGALASALRLPGVLDGGVAVPHDGDLIGLAAARPRLTPQPGVTVGLGPQADPAALPASLVVATRATQTAAAFHLSGVHTLASLTPHVIAHGDVALAQALHERCVAPVTGAGAADVLDTVRAFLAHELGADAAAAALGVHPNTVRNRLHRFEALTGVSLRDLDDLLQVRVALLHDEVTGGG